MGTLSLHRLCFRCASDSACVINVSMASSILSHVMVGETNKVLSATSSERLKHMAWL